MSPELGFSSPSAAPTRARALCIAQDVLHWTPFSLALLFLGQILVLGWLPARQERARVDQAEVEVRARAARLGDEERELAEEARMLQDRIYQERVRRSLGNPGAEPLTLERARSGSSQ